MRLFLLILIASVLMVPVCVEGSTISGKSLSEEMYIKSIACPDNPLFASYHAALQPYKKKRVKATAADPLARIALEIRKAQINLGLQAALFEAKSRGLITKEAELRHIEQSLVSAQKLSEVKKFYEQLLLVISSDLAFAKACMLTKACAYKTQLQNLENYLSKRKRSRSRLSKLTIKRKIKEVEELIKKIPSLTSLDKVEDCYDSLGEIRTQVGRRLSAARVFSGK